MKRYIYSSGLDIIAPLKCGTRWLEDFDKENRIQIIGLHPTDLPNHIHSGTTFIWRPVREHFLSAIETDYYVEPDRTDMWESILHYQEYGGHWYPYLYKKLYPIWKKTRFRFWKLRALSELNEVAAAMPYHFKQYHFIVPKGYSTAEEAINSLPSKHTNRLNKLIGDEEKWLQLMVEPQYSEKSWEDYSDLEDSLFKMKCKVKDMEAEVKLFEERMNRKLEIQKTRNLDLDIQIRELKDSNLKLQAKLDYSESVFGKIPIKLI
jgi:hypothetical protein